MKRLFTIFILMIFLSYSAEIPQVHTKFAAVKAISDANVSDTETICTDTLKKLSETLTEPDVGTIGGDWSVLCLARGEYEGTGKEYYDSYLKRAESSIKQLSESSGKNNGALHRSKSTENSRIILTLGSIGSDPRNINGIDLVKPLEDLEWVKKQGINGVIYALIAVDSCSYPYPDDLHEKLIEMILQNQLSDCGWSLDNASADPDITAIAIQALSKYTYRPEIKEAVEKGLTCLSSLYIRYFENENIRNSETLSQIITACTCCKTDPGRDPAFIYNGISVLNELLSYYDPEASGFRHIKSGNSNSMATDQALMALISYDRMLKDKPGIFNMNEINNYLPYPKVVGTSLDIKEGLNLKIYLKAEENVAKSSVKVFDLTDSSELIRTDLNSINNTENNSCHVLSVPLKYNCINDILNISIYNSDRSYNKNITYSARNYLQNVSDSTESSEMKDIISRILELGTDIQLYENNKSASSKITADSENTDITPSFLSEKRPFSYRCTDDSVEYLGSEMIIDSIIKVRHTFLSEKIPENISDYTANANGGYIFQTENILTADCFFDISEYNYSFGCLDFSASDYLSCTWTHTDNVFLRQLCCSIYNYEQSVKLFNNL